MKLYTCYTPSHRALLEQHFLPSLPAEFDGPVTRWPRRPGDGVPLGSRVVVQELTQYSGTGAFASDGFQRTCLDKVDLILEALDKETEPFLFSDVDVRFYGPVVDDLTKLLGVADMAFQWDGNVGRECSGFMVIRPSARSKRFWAEVRSAMVASELMDQDAVHSVLDRGTSLVSHVMLPARYWTVGRDDKHWSPGMPVNPPAGILVHHANWTVGVPNKMALLNAVQSTVEHLATLVGQIGSGDSQLPPDHGPVPRCTAIPYPTVTVNEACDLLTERTAKPKVNSYRFRCTECQHEHWGGEPCCGHREACREVAAPAQDETPQHMLARNEMGITAAVSKLLEAERARLTRPQHHPLPLALVLQFWKGDKRRALELARLVTDLEPVFRDDVGFVFARQQNCPMDADIWNAGLYAGKKFPVIHIETTCDEAKPYPGVCFDPWASACDKLATSYYAGKLPYANVFFFEPDGCPIGSDWIDRLKQAHAETLLQGKRVTGPRIRFGGIDHQHQVGGHINGTLVMHLSCWFDHPSLRRCPPDAAWDVFHGTVLTNEAGTSQIIRNEYGGHGLSESLYWVMAKEHAWITSLKDGLAQHWCRKAINHALGAG